ncbi:HesA/MoeB/ThiF family protein [Pedobacter sp. MC2016-14]|uniref:HesA/MoeB/ThiF family protein n=1 Tax=Pedobacter sp. MC2016-14 TaxID=2897327 RepID=UPI001E3EAC4B|nr:HesA/MoeB/ThiF family protein [Pedobacter sp. MC2016-14]MCD0489733.1 HesA/MoeB/ThiF family protein [Pedobacter sp. MC2016-14]
MTDESYNERYSRQMILQDFGLKGQEKLGAAKVLVIGAGGLGCPALLYLAAAGIGTIGIADDDVVTLSNLHRQVLYSTADIGTAKVSAAALKLSNLNPEIVVQQHREKVVYENAREIIGGYDYVIDGTDNFAARYLINDVCVLMNKPLVFGAVSRYQGQLAVFNVPGENLEKTNYRDLFPIPPKASEVPSCEEAGVLGALPGIIGAMQAAEVIKLITGIGEPLVNKVLMYNALNHDFYKVALSPTALGESLVVGYEEPIEEIDAVAFRALLEQPSTLVIDVRERGEMPSLSGIAQLHIPMSEFDVELVVPEEHLILVCQHGIRSLHAAEMLQEWFGQTKKLYSLKGGVSRLGSEFLSSLAPEGN